MQKWYRYLRMPPEVFAELQAAASKGTFLAERIKGVYDCTPVLVA
jgi:KTSC domain